MASRPATDSATFFGALEIGMRHAAVAGIGRHQQLVLVLGVVQRIVEPRDHARGVAEGRMRGDVLDALAVDVDLAAVAQRLQKLLAVHRRRGSDVADGLRLLGKRHLIVAHGGLRHCRSSHARVQQCVRSH